MAYLITGVVCLLVGAGAGWWIGKKGVKNVAGDVTQAAEDVKSKV